MPRMNITPERRAELIDERLGDLRDVTVRTLDELGITDTLTLQQASGLMTAALDYAMSEAAEFAAKRGMSKHEAAALAKEIGWLTILANVAALEVLVDRQAENVSPEQR